MRYLRTNTATRVTVGPFLSQDDGITPELALTVTAETVCAFVDTGGVPTITMTGINPTASGGDNDMVHITDDEGGFYDLELSAAQLNYVGRMMLTINDVTTHCPVFHEFHILPAVVYDAMVLGTDLFDVSLTQVLGTAVTPTVAGVLEVDVTHANGVAITTTGAVDANVVSVSGDTSAADNMELMFDGTGYSGGTQPLNVNVAQISTDSTAADNLELMFDGTGYAGGSIRLAVNAAQIGGVNQTGYDVGPGVISVLTNIGTPAGVSLAADLAAIEAQTDDIGAAGAGLTALASQASVNTIDDFLDTEIGAIKTKTDFLPSATAGAAGGLTIAGANAATTFATLTSTGVLSINGVTMVSQTGDSFARLGAPAGASVSADLAAIESQTDDIGAAGAGLTALCAQATANAIVTLIGAPVVSLAADIAGIEGGSGLDAAETRAALGMASANMDTQLGALSTKLGTPAGASISADIAVIENQTDEIGAAGAGLTALASQASVNAIGNDVVLVLADTADMQPKIGTPVDTLAADIAEIEATGLSAAETRTALGMASANLDTQLADLPTNTELTASHVTYGALKPTVAGRTVAVAVDGSVTSDVTLSPEDITEIAQSVGLPTDLDAEPVPTGRVFTLVEKTIGLRSERTKTIIAGAPPNTYAVDFREDAADNQKIYTVNEVEIVSGTAGGVTFSDEADWGREGTQAKFRITGVTAGDYTVRVEVTYLNGNTSRGDITITVVDWMRLHSILFASAYADRYNRMARVLEASTAENSPLTPLTLHRIGLPDDDVQSYVRPNCKQTYIDNARKAKHHAWIINEADDGEVLGLLDSDTMVLSDLSEMDQMHTDIAITIRPPGSKWLLNTGVYFVRVSQWARDFVNEWARIACDMLRDSELHEHYRKTLRYGGLHQAGFGYMTGDCSNITITCLPCEIWNCVNGCYETAQNPKILHLMRGSMREWCFTPELKHPKNANIKRWIKQWRAYDVGAACLRT